MQMIGAIISPFTVPLCWLLSCFGPMEEETQQGTFEFKLLLRDSPQMFTESSAPELALNQCQGAPLSDSVVADSGLVVGALPATVNETYSCCLSQRSTGM